MPIQSEGNIRLKIVQLLEVSPVIMSDGGKSVLLQLSHKDEIEPAMQLSLWDSIRLLNDVMIALATHDYSPAVETMSFMYDRWGNDNGFREDGDPTARPLPPAPPKPQGKPKRSRKK